MNVFAVAYFYFKMFRKCVYNRRTDTVQTARYLVSAATEFTAGVKNCKYNFDCRNTLLWVNTDRNTTTVICDGH